MRIETRKAPLSWIREANINKTGLENFTLANLSKNEIELKLSSNIILKSPSSEILNQAIADNTFENPVFRSNEENCRNNWQTDPTIKTYSYEDETLVLPRGYMRDLLKAFKDNGITTRIIDDRRTNPCEYQKKLNGITLRGYQQRAVDQALNYDQGVILMPTGSGKSLVGLELIRRRGQKAMVCVHRADLARQWEELIKVRLGIVPGFIGDGRCEIGDITVAMIQSLASQEALINNLSNTFGLILLDEHHHCPAVSTFHILGQLSAKYRYGLSASRNRRDGLETIVNRAIGHEIATISKLEAEAVGAVVPATVISINTGFNPGSLNSWHDYQAAIACDASRNLLIIELAQKSLGAVLILVDRVCHAEQLSDMLTRRKIDHVLAHGKIAKKDRGAIVEKIKSSKLTIGTTSLLGEGLDIAIWGTLIMGAPISSEIKLTQAIGRIVRPAEGKKVAVVLDLKDNHPFSGASFNKRFEIYKKNRIWVEFR